MKISSIGYNYSQITQINRSRYQTNPLQCNLPVIQADTVSFQGVREGSAPLKALVKYGIPDMYTGLRLIDPKYIEDLILTSAFKQPLEKLFPILNKQKDTMLPVAKHVLHMLEKHSKKYPQSNIQEALKFHLAKHEKDLINVQTPILEELTQAACNLPEGLKHEFDDLIYTAHQRINRKSITTPFSKKTFIYKLQQVKHELIVKKNKDGVRDVNTLIRIVNSLFEETDASLKEITSRKTIRSKKLEHQLQPEILKQNLEKFKIVREFFEKSKLKNNKELIRILNNTSNSIRGRSIQAPFKSKEFVYDLKRITRRIKDKELASEMVKIAHKLPRSAENFSAFIVKYANETPDKIGFSLLKEGIASIDHIKPKNKGGKKNDLSNFGLCSTYINTKKTNISFDTWCRIHPEIYKNCQKHVDRLIELYNQGIFEKEGVKRDYIIDFAKTIKELSPEEKPLILDLSKLKD